MQTVKFHALLKIDKRFRPLGTAVTKLPLHEQNPICKDKDQKLAINLQ